MFKRIHELSLTVSAKSCEFILQVDNSSLFYYGFSRSRFDIGKFQNQPNRLTIRSVNMY